MSDGGFYRWGDQGVELFVRLTPKSSRDAIEGTSVSADGRSHLKARVRAVPEDGKANAALVKLVAKTFKAPVSSVIIISGQTARLKTVRIADAGPEIKERLVQLARE